MASCLFCCFVFYFLYLNYRYWIQKWVEEQEKPKPEAASQSSTCSSKLKTYRPECENTIQEERPPSRPEKITETDEFFKELNKDPLFSMMVKYQTTRRYAAYLKQSLERGECE